MNRKHFSMIIFEKLKKRIESHKGLWIFAHERAKFEGWLKVEVCDILAEYVRDVTPEKGLVDITFEDWAVELKTLNTNIRYDGVKSKHRPITKNTQGVVDDINALKKNAKYENKAVLFVVFPIDHDRKEWQTQLNRITSKLKRIEHTHFMFKGLTNIPGEIYIGYI